MKNTNTKTEAKATTKTNTTNNQNTKKEEKVMTKKVENTTTTTIPEGIDQNILVAYKTNEAGEFLMTNEMFEEFKKANAESLAILNTKADATIKGIALKGTKKPFAKVRIDETAKKKQVHIHTGATKKVCSARDDKTDMRYKVIFVEAKNRFELWSADNGGKRKKMVQGTEAEVMKEYHKYIPEEKATGKTATKAKKSA